MKPEDAKTELEFLMAELMRVKLLKWEKDKELSEIAAYLEELEGGLRAEFTRLGVTSCKDAEGNGFSLKTNESVKIDDFEKFLAYVVQTGNYQLLQKRVATKAAKEICDVTGAMIPGLVPYKWNSIHIRGVN